jgi:two-component system, NtrC family, nitrogen regulation response regulator NtrX
MVKKEIVNIMVVDDELGIRNSLSNILNDEGFSVTLAKNGIEAMEQIKKVKPNLVLLDIWMPKMDGIITLQKIKDEYPDIEVVMISGHGTIETAVKATKLGAYDFIEKPLSIDTTLETIHNALKDQQKEQKINKTKLLSSNHEIIGQNKTIIDLLKQIDIAAPTNSWVLITGESGTGKELVARRIYKLSKRSNGPFVDVNCAAIPEELIESELFGHIKGSFTGAIMDKPGKFELSNKGTLFLDEVGDMSLKTQAKVLRVLEEQTCQRIGSSECYEFNTRVISASNKDLLLEIKNGNFREDLYYRLNVIPVHVPPLRERLDDIPILVDYFLENITKENNLQKKKISKEVILQFQNYSWPGNIRELKNLLERLVILVQSDIINILDIDLPEQNYSNQNSDSKNTIIPLKTIRKDFEKNYIINLLNKNNWNIPKTAKMMNIERNNLYKKIKNYAIEVPEE